MKRPPPRSPPFPNTTLFRPHVRRVDRQQVHPTAQPVGQRRVEVALVHPAADRREVAPGAADGDRVDVGRVQLRSEEHTSELQSRQYLVCRLLLEKKKTIQKN